MERKKQIQVFLALSALYILNYNLRKYGLSNHFTKCWLNDILCLPVILCATLFIQRIFIFRNWQYIYTRKHILFSVMYVGVLFELILPALSARYRGDIWDILAYTTGGVLFYIFLNKPAHKTSLQPVNGLAQ